MFTFVFLYVELSYFLERRSIAKMIYRIFNPLVGWTMRRYFKNIHVTGLKHIPKKSAVIFACNHPSSFMEPMLLASIQSRKLYYLVRGDIFKGKFVKWALKETHQIPIYRRKDGISNLKQNDKTFRICYKMLLNNGALMIFPEGSTETVKQLRPLQRGIWRLAFGTLARDRNIDMVIVPVGVNFTNPDKIRSEVMISFGPPVSLNKHYEEYEADKPGTMKKLSAMLYESMRPHVVHFMDKSYEKDGEKLLSLVRNEIGDKDRQFIRNDRQLKREKKMAQRYSDMDDEQRKRLSDKVNAYLSKLPDATDSDYIIARNMHLGKRWKTILYSIPGAIGMLLGYLPYKFAIWGQRKLINNDPPFHPPIRVALFLLSMLLLMLVSFIALFAFIGVYAFLIFLTPLFITMGAIWWDQLRLERAKIRLLRSGLDIEALIKEREEILSIVKD